MLEEDSFDPTESPSAEDSHVTAKEYLGGTFERKRLDALLAGEMPPPDWLIEGVILRGTVTILYGQPEQGKTIIATKWMLDACAAGNRVAFVDEESGHVNVANRLRSMGAGSVDEFLYYLPTPSIHNDLLAHFVDVIKAYDIDFVVIDSLTDVLATASVDENDGVGVTRWMKDLPAVIAQLPRRPAIVLIDHLTKAGDNTRFAVGSRAKEAKADAQYLVEKKKPFGPQNTATVELKCEKNRPGHLPKSVMYEVGGRNGLLICELQSIDGKPCGALADYTDDVSALDDVDISIIAALADGPKGNAGIKTFLETTKNVSLDRTTIVKRLQTLINKDIVESQGSNRTTTYSLRRIYEKEPEITLASN